MNTSNKIAKFLIIVSFFGILLLPIFSFAEDSPGLVPCGVEKSDIVVGSDGKETGGEIINPCETDGFGYLMEMINLVINFILFKMAVPIAAIMFAYAGFLLVFSGGEPAYVSH